MLQPSLASAARTALCATSFVLAAAAAHAASPPYTAVVGTCQPANLATLQYDLKLTNGAVRKAGRNPPSSVYYCDVPIDTLTAPSYNRMELKYLDKNTTGNGHVVARLMRKHLTTGIASELARVSSVPSATLRTAVVSLPSAMDFRVYEFYLIVSLTTPLAEVEAHTVRFVTR